MRELLTARTSLNCNSQLAIGSSNLAEPQFIATLVVHNYIAR